MTRDKIRLRDTIDWFDVYCAFILSPLTIMQFPVGMIVWTMYVGGLFYKYREERKGAKTRDTA